MSSESNSTDNALKLATAQRQRTILLYNAFCRPVKDTRPKGANLQVKLFDSKAPLTASALAAVDSSESKFAVTGLDTNWGLYKGTVCVRGSDIAYIDLDLK